MNALATFANNYETRVGSKLQSQKEENDRLITASLVEQDRISAEKERIKLEERKLKLKQSTEYNIAMIEQKRLAKEAEKLDALDRRKLLEMELIQQKRREREAAEEKRIRMIELKQNLDEQVSRRGRDDQSSIGLTNIEATINKVRMGGV